MSVGGYLDYNPNEFDYFRSIILFGKNIASYKFALGKSILELASQDREIVTLEELSEPMSRYTCEHLKRSPKQITNPRVGGFLTACNEFNAGAISKETLIEKTVQHAYGDVIERFHNLQSGSTEVKFYEFENVRSANQRMILSSSIFQLAESSLMDLSEEIESRWRLVETAWALGISESLIQYDSQGEILITQNGRVSVTSVRPALNGYQRGRCFYCYREIEIVAGSENLAEVDHLFPHVLQRNGFIKNLDGVWNLVLACVSCNRGKSDQVAAMKYVVALEDRNNFLIGSHHPLKKTLELQTGNSEERRHAFLQAAFNNAQQAMPGSEWRTDSHGESPFPVWI